MLEETVAVARRVHRFSGHATIRQAARAAGKKMRRPVDPNTGASSVAVGVRACVCQCSATVDRRLVRPVSIRCGGADDRKRKAPIFVRAVLALSLRQLGDCAMADGESGAKALNASRMNSAGGLEFAPEIAAALSECVSSAELSWLALGYESKKALKLLATGSSGGYAALKPHLADDAVVYSAFKVACAGSQKLVFLSSIGPNAGGMASRHQHSNQLPATSR